MTIEEIEAAALKLPAEPERLGEKLLSSVGTPLLFEDEWQRRRPVAPKKSEAVP